MNNWFYNIPLIFNSVATTLCVPDDHRRSRLRSRPSQVQVATVSARSQPFPPKRSIQNIHSGMSPRPCLANRGYDVHKPVYLATAQVMRYQVTAEVDDPPTSPP